ncbi:hypothetical protein [uncultured Jannaschia sp.]|uniref:hypothetical protein n=1 Tax=uncultured Jannaschia sp. TaxID=293347 RepID=UPI0026346AD9|nr:hypothetical protein [uncultured Jannaschia sp.]
MVNVAAFLIFAAAFWVPTLLPRRAGLIVATLTLAACAALIVRAAMHVSSTTHFDIAREAGIAVGAAFAVAPLAAIIYLVSIPAGERRLLSRAIYLVLALAGGAAVGALAFFSA